MFNQQASVQKIKDNIEKIIQERFPMPIQGGFEIYVDNVRLSEPSSTLEAQERAYLTDSSLKAPVKVDIRVTKDGETVVDRKNVTFAHVPYPTERGSYIINGNENVIINQMVLRPGVFVHPKKKLKDGTFLNAEVRSGRTRFVFTYNEEKGSLDIENLSLEFGKNPSKVEAVPFLRLVGLSESEIQNAIGDDEIYRAVLSNSKKTPKDVFGQLFTTPYENEEQARNYLNEQMANRLTFDDKGKKVTNIMIGQTADFVDKNILLGTIRGLFKEEKAPGTSPNIDDIRFKNIYGPEDTIARVIDNGINQWKKNIITAIRFNKLNNPKAVFSPSTVVTKEVDKLYRSSLVEHVASGNVLDLYQNQRKITLGAPEFGGLSLLSTTNAARSLQDSAFGKVDPIETPQSLSLGYTQHLSKDVRVENNTLYSSFYKVNNGVVDKSTVIQDIDPIDEYDVYVAFNSPKQLEEVNGQLRLKGNKIRARYRGNFVDVEPSKIQYIDKTSTSHIGNATALIPFGAHNDGSRMLMGASMQRQALALENPDEPLVQSIETDDGETMEKKIADENSYLLKSPVNGEITNITDNNITITDTQGKKVVIPKLNYHVNNKSGGFINHKPVVNVGDQVREGQLLADGWQSKNGKLALGRNTTVAFMPFKGLNFEDGVVVSQSWADSMESEELKIIEREVFYGEGNVARQEVKARLKELMVSPGVLDKLDENGIIKKGMEVNKGDILIGSIIQKEKDHMSAAENILSRIIIQTARDSYADNSTKVEGYQRGRVVDVQTVESGETTKVLIKLVSLKPMDKGDKLAGRHGNKGTISAVLPDNEMPRTEDGKVVDLIFSPLAVPSRKNVGQLLEVNAGLIAQRKGLPSYNVKNFDDRTDLKIMRELEEVGAPEGKLTLIDPDTGKPFENPVTVGPMYVMKLKHKVEGKISARNYVGAIDKLTDMPKKVSGATDGERHSPQSIGGMEFWSLTSAGAVNNIHEMTTLKSDGSGFNHNGSMKSVIYDALKTGTPMPEPATPQTVKVLQNQLYAAGLSMTPLRGDKEVTLDEKFNSLMLTPLRKDDIARLAPKSVLNPKTFNSRTKDTDKKGFYGEEVFGKDGTQWGKIDVVEPIANPLFIGNASARPYEAMLRSKGISQQDITKVVQDGHYIVLNPKDSGFEQYQVLTAEQVEEAEILEDKEFDVATGSSAIHTLLKDVNLKDELKKAEEELQAIRNETKNNSGKSTQALLDRRNNTVKHIKLLGAALDNGFEPTDYLLPFVPVLPVTYREPVQTGNNGVAEDGITLLYQSFMKKQEEFKKALQKNAEEGAEMDRDVRAGLEAKLFKDLQHIIGTETYQDKSRGVEYKGIINRLASKEGFIRDKMQSKAQDYSGRSVIIGAPDLSLDEVRLPEDMIAEIWRPQIEGQLVRQRYNRDEIKEAFKERNEAFRKAATKVAESEVVVLDRQPSLHRHSTQGFKPIISWNAEGKNNLAIGLNPLVTTGFNADFDGDSLLNSVFVRYSIIGIKKEECYNELKGGDFMPLSSEENIRYRHGLINMKEFPRGDLLEVKGNKEIYAVPKGVEILTVWNNEEKWLPVESYSIHKNLEMIEVQTNTSRTLQVSNDHSLVTIDEDLNYLRAPAKIGMTLPRLRKPIDYEGFSFLTKIDLPKKEEAKYRFDDELSLTLEVGYFFGVYIGDGWVNSRDVQKNKHAIYLADTEGYVIERVQSIIQNLNKSEQEIYYGSVDSPHIFDGKQSFSRKHTWSSSRFSTLLRDNIGMGAANKHLPTFWLESTPEFRWGLLSGLIDTDGSVGYTKKGEQLAVTYTTTSRQLAFEVVGLAHSLNLTASALVSQKSNGTGESWVVVFTQESIEQMKKRLWVSDPLKVERLEKFKLSPTAKRNKYTPKLSKERLLELRSQLLKKGNECKIENTEIAKKMRSLYTITSRVKDRNEAITRQTALNIFEIMPEFFEDAFWAKWRSLVLDENIEWELVTSIKPIPFITEAYDLTVPPNYTMVTESGIVVYDTMAVHVPITTAAKKEVREKLMPSQNLLNPTSNSLIMELKHEMILGLFYMTRDRMPENGFKEFKDINAVRKAYDRGDIRTYDGVSVNIPQKGLVRTTAGKVLFNSPLPPALMDFEKNVNMKQKDVEKIILKIVENPKYGPMRAVQVMNAWKDIGFDAATKSAVSIGVKDFAPVMKIDKKSLFDDAEKNINAAKYIDNLDAFETKKSEFVAERVEQLIKEEGILGEDNPVEIMRASGARGNAGQIQAMGVFIGHGKKVDESAIRPVKSSLIEGTSPDEFWDLSNDSRKGIYDRSVATQEPGALTRQLWMANKQTVITEKDCGDLQGIVLNMNIDYERKGLQGRILLSDVPLKDGKGIIKSKKGIPLTRQEIEQIRNFAQNPSQIRVRSPLSCKANNGICQFCYGAKPGSVTNQLVPIGEAVGSIAAQGIGEPSQQAIMKTFHVGSGQNQVGSGFVLIRDALTQTTDTKGDQYAVVAKKDGTVKSILNDPIKGTTIVTDSGKYQIGMKPKAPNVIPGALLKAGDALTDLEQTELRTADVLKFKGVDAAKAQLTAQLSDAFKAGGTDHIDRRHAELVVGNMLGKSVVEDSEGSPFLPGQIVNTKILESYNNQKEVDVPISYTNRVNVIGSKSARKYSTLFGKTIVDKGQVITEDVWNQFMKENRKSIKIIPNQVSYTPTITSIEKGTKGSNTNWLESAGYKDVRKAVTTGAAHFQVDRLDNPLTRQMTGLKGNFGDGFGEWYNDLNKKFGELFL